MKFKYIITIESVVFLIGLVAIISGLLIDIKKLDTIFRLERAIAQNIFLSVGCSIIASSIISSITTLYLNADKDARKVIETWGLKNIEIRSNLNSDINMQLEKMSYGMDIVAFGMKNFLAAKRSLLELKIKQGCTIRILTMHPDSQFLSQRDQEEGNVSGQIKNEIEEMIKWAKKIHDDPNKKGAIEIRTYKGLPHDTYQKVDNYVYVAPLQFGKTSQQTIAYEYKPGSKGAQYYTKYFLDIWQNDSFSEKIF
jgi:hypothetical protein